MSRSRKKPYVGSVCHSRGSIAKWKGQCNKKIRLMPVDEELGDMNYYKKISDAWNRPDDGKFYWDDPKGRRK